MTWWRMGKSTRVRSPSEAAGSASRDGAAMAAALRPRLEEEDLTKPLPIAEPGKQQRSAAAAAMRAASGLWERRGEPVASACGRLDLGPPRQGQAMASVDGCACATDRWASTRSGASTIQGPANVSLVALAAGLPRAAAVMWVSVFQKSFSLLFCSKKKVFLYLREIFPIVNATAAILILTRYITIVHQVHEFIIRIERGIKVVYHIQACKAQVTNLLDVVIGET